MRRSALIPALCFAVMTAPAQRARKVTRDDPGTPPKRTSSYVNPLSIEDTRSVADPTAIRFRGKYYLFLTGGMVWSSNDLVHWLHQPVSLPGRARRVAAPDVFAYHDYLYLTGNDTGLYRSREAIGPWEYVGDFKDEKGGKMLLFDSMVFVDDDGRVYLYYSGRHTDGIYGVELKRDDLTSFAGQPHKFWGFNKSHVWERYGDSNEGTEVSWIEAPWMTKRNGTYYLQYSAPGTEWKTYAVGVYTSKHPLGPFTYASRNPILAQRNGLINGTGHHCIIEGPDGQFWAIYTILYRNWGVFDRRIGLDPVGFDRNGNMFVNGPSEIPQWTPGVKSNASLGDDTGNIPVSIDRYSWSASSSRPGRSAYYAFDNNVRTWWEPAANDAQPSLTLDLGCRNPTDPIQEFLISSSRILFDAAPPEETKASVDGHQGFYSEGGRGIAAGAYQYELEVSSDNHSYEKIVDKTNNSRANNIEFDEFPAVRCRYIRLTITGAPKNQPIAVLDFTVFGKSVESTPGQN
ncbi:MAG TPA: family 43 glycosylhydrolase [Bryobacteraceae bacterium]|nr:family 43 glycosylhydrolase [Bryobacteraceae bacterium]